MTSSILIAYVKDMFLVIFKGIHRSIDTSIDTIHPSIDYQRCVHINEQPSARQKFVGFLIITNYIIIKLYIFTCLFTANCGVGYVILVSAVWWSSRHEKNLQKLIFPIIILEVTDTKTMNHNTFTSQLVLVSCSDNPVNHVLCNV